MFEFSLTGILAMMMLVAGDILILICAGSAGLALLFSFIRQRELFIRFWAGGLFVLLFSVPGMIAKVSWQDTSASPVGLFFPMTDLVAGLLIAIAAAALVVSLVIRRRFAYGVLS